MPNKKADKTVIDDVVEPKEKAQPKVLVRAPVGKTYSFEQWAMLRKKPKRHLGGMRAFLGSDADKKFSLEMWDSKMKAY